MYITAVEHNDNNQLKSNFPSLSHFSHLAHCVLNLSTPAIALSKFLTPASLVHPVTTSLSMFPHPSLS